jgi:hypothetical protein
MVMTLYGVCIGAYGALLPVVTDVPYLGTGERIVAFTATWRVVPRKRPFGKE